MTKHDLQQFIRRNGWAWPGGYPLVLVMSDGDVIDAQAARENYRLIREAMKTCDKRSGWLPDGLMIHWEGPPLYCAHSGREIPSAYGDPSEDGDGDNCTLEHDARCSLEGAQDSQG